MKITDFLKRHSLIDDQFIDDFYSFYDDGHNEYDYTINLEKLAFWLKVQKRHLRKNIMLNYTCAKELCMLSRSDKSSIIHQFYIDLEKLIKIVLLEI